MVCSVGSMKMAVIARILASGSFSQAVTEKPGRQRLVTQYIQKELLEADESNLLDEEDMHVFDLNPLTDPLHLVCCSSCKKPVKASQFIAHAELCRSLGFAEELLSEPDSGTGNRKPPRKEKKKLISAGSQKTSTGAQQRFAVVDASETAVSTSQLVEHAGVTTCLDGSKENVGMISSSDGEMTPLPKRPKLVASDTVQPSDDIQAAQCVGSIIHCHGASTYVPVPLATKTYYSQRNNHLKSAVSYMYHQASIDDCNIDKMESQGNPVNWETSVPRIFSDEHFNNCFDKKHFDSPSTENADKITNRNSEVSLDKDGCQSLDDSLNQISMTDAYISQSAAFGAMTTRYHSVPYSLSGKSGTPLPPIKQPNGTVPVV